LPLFFTKICSTDDIDDMTQVRNTQNQTGTKPIVIEEKTTTIS
jgi:hypothetical protein